MSTDLHQLWQALNWPDLLLHFLGLSLLAVAGAITAAPDMHRYLVNKQGWLTDTQFTESIAIAQAAPGPNVLFIALIGWNIGINAAGWLGGALGLVLSLAGMMIPSSLLTFATASWSHRNRERREVRAFKQGMTPIVVALMVGGGWVVATAQGYSWSQLPFLVASVVATVLVWRTRIHLLWLLAGGAVLGALGWI
jgi:chromate transporter